MLLNFESFPIHGKEIRGLSGLNRINEDLVFARSIALINIMKNYVPDLPEISAHDDRVLDHTTLIESAIDRFAPYTEKLTNIGMTPREHVNMYADSFVGKMRPVKQVIAKTEKRMRRKHVKSSISSEDPTQMRERHMGIVRDLLKDIPTAQEVGETQRIMIVAGPFASGKSEILEHLNTKNMLSIDLDIIRKMLSTNYDSVNQKDIQRVREESWRVSDLLSIEALNQGKSVLMQTALHRRSRWLNDPTMLLAKEKGIPIEITMILRPVTDCMNRNIHRTRSVTMKDLYESMNGMDVLIKFVQKFGNVAKRGVNLVDFYPMLRESQVLSPKAFEYQYKKLIKYARSRPDIFSIYTKSSELDILPE